MSFPQQNFDENYSERKVSFADSVSVAEEDPKKLFLNPISIEMFQIKKDTESIILPSRENFKLRAKHFFKKILFVLIAFAMICWLIDKRIITPEISILKRFNIEFDAQQFNNIERISLLAFLLYCLPIE